MDHRARTCLLGFLSLSGCAVAENFTGLSASPDGGALSADGGGTPPVVFGAGGTGGDGAGAAGTTARGGTLGSGGKTNHGGSSSVGAGGDVAPGSGGTLGSGGAEAGGTTTDPPPPASGGSPSSTPGGTLSRRTTGGGRSYLVYVPGSIDPKVPVPLLFVHHGYNGSADQIRALTHFDDIAEERHFVAVFPEGAGSTWNAGLLVCGFGQFVTGFSDDFGFEQEMITAISQSVAIDRGRVFVTGFSMGGYFSNNVGCMRPDLVKGIAPHSGGGPPAGCGNSRMPAIILHGSADPLIFYDCGVQAQKYWITHNGCSSAVDTVQVKGGSCDWSRGCPDGGQVVFCHFDGMVHGWAGATGKDGGGAQYENASRLVWDFFEKQ